MFVGDMADESGDEVQDRQRHGFFFVGIMVEILVGNRFSIVEFDTGFPNRGTFEIFAEIVNIGIHVVRLFVEVDNPWRVIELGSPGIKECRGGDMFKV